MVTYPYLQGMTIDEALSSYLEHKDQYYGLHGENNPSLLVFKKAHPNLSSVHIAFLINLLAPSNNKLEEKFFTAELLGLYTNYSDKLFEPLMNMAINYRDPSYTRFFLRPCLYVFGVGRVIDYLIKEFKQDDLGKHMGVCNLCYHLPYYASTLPIEVRIEAGCKIRTHIPHPDIQRLLDLIANSAINCNSRVEVYLLQEVFKNTDRRLKSKFNDVPKDGDELDDLISTNKEEAAVWKRVREIVSA